MLITRYIEESALAADISAYQYNNQRHLTLKIEKFVYCISFACPSFNLVYQYTLNDILMIYKTKENDSGSNKSSGVLVTEPDFDAVM